MIGHVDNSVELFRNQLTGLLQLKSVDGIKELQAGICLGTYASSVSEIHCVPNGACYNQ